MRESRERKYAWMYKPLKRAKSDTRCFMVLHSVAFGMDTTLLRTSFFQAFGITHML